MRMLMKVSIPMVEGSAAIMDGSLGTTIASILGEMKPEAVYFAEENGARTGYVFLQSGKGIANSGDCGAVVSGLQRQGGIASVDELGRFEKFSAGHGKCGAQVWAHGSFCGRVGSLFR